MDLKIKRTSRLTCLSRSSFPRLYLCTPAGFFSDHEPHTPQGRCKTTDARMRGMFFMRTHGTNHSTNCPCLSALLHMVAPTLALAASLSSISFKVMTPDLSTSSMSNAAFCSSTSGLANHQQRQADPLQIDACNDCLFTIPTSPLNPATHTHTHTPCWMENT